MPAAPSAVALDLVIGPAIASAEHQNNYTAIQTALNALIAILDGGSSGQVLTRIGASDVDWSSGQAQLVTALPPTPNDGDEIILVDSATAPTYAWHLRYIAAKATNKWQFVGGAPLLAEVTASETTTSTSFVALTTGGPSIPLPVAGDYFVEVGFTGGNDAGGRGAAMSYDIGGTGAVDADMATSGYDTNVFPSVSRVRKKAGLTAVTLTAKYRVANSVGTATFSNRWMRVTPIALGG